MRAHTVASLVQGAICLCVGNPTFLVAALADARKQRVCVSLGQRRERLTLTRDVECVDDLMRLASDVLREPVHGLATTGPRSHLLSPALTLEQAGIAPGDHLKAVSGGARVRRTTSNLFFP